MARYWEDGLYVIEGETFVGNVSPGPISHLVIRNCKFLGDG